MLDIMLDLETMGTGPQAAIIAIGAVEFDSETHEIGQRFYLMVDLESSVRTGGTMDASTVLWWMQQSDEARGAFAQDGDNIVEALRLFSRWMGDRGPREGLKVWGNSSSFDNVILAAAYQRLSLPLPWVWQGDRCYRTLKKMHPEIIIERSGTHHNAADDAESQTRHLIAILRSSKLSERASSENPKAI